MTDALVVGTLMLVAVVFVVLVSVQVTNPEILTTKRRIRKPVQDTDGLDDTDLPRVE